MPITVRIPPHLRKHTEKRADIEVEGSTVLEALQDLTHRCPELQDRLFRDDSALVTGLNIFLNHDSIKRLDGISTAVTDGDRIVLLLAMSGG